MRSRTKSLVETVFEISVISSMTEDLTDDGFLILFFFVFFLSLKATTTTEIDTLLKEDGRIRRLLSSFSEIILYHLALEREKSCATSHTTSRTAEESQKELKKRKRRKKKPRQKTIC